MEQLSIQRLVDLRNGPSYQPALLAIKEIFFQTSARKTFENDQARQQFFNNWTGLYFESYLELFYVAVHNDRNVILGYLTGCDDSQLALEYFKDRVASYETFADQFDEFPAHLHINCLPGFQGMGIGQKLMQKFFADLKIRSVDGVHIVTAADSRNVSFYQRLGFDFSMEKDFRGSRLRLMGKKLST